MGDVRRCQTCERYIYGNQSHECQLGWLVWDPDAGQAEDDATTIHALDPSAAAVAWAERSDRRGDYEIVGGSAATVCVRLADRSGNVMNYIVEGESVPSYSARQCLNGSCAPKGGKDA